MKRSCWQSVTWVLGIVFVVGCGSGGKTRQPDVVKPAQPSGYQATIRWTSYGVPHILADDLGSLTFGQGYAFAKQFPCVLGRQIVKIRGEYAANFGPGPKDRYVNQDLGYKSVDLLAWAKRLHPQMSPETRAVMEGFVAGYNHRLAKQDPAEVPAACRGASWLRPITVDELLAYGINISMIGSVGAMIHMVGQAQPPSSEKAAQVLPGLDHPLTEALASNAWGIGAERSANGHGLLLANPHFPWRGPLRFYEAHLTVPGKLNAYGANLLGLPLVSIAFNEHLAWSHTFSASRRFAIYRLTLDPKDPTKYKYGKETRSMTKKQLSVQVKQSDGSIKTVSRTLYHSHYGPIVVGGRLSWSKNYAFTVRDAASPGNRSIDQYLAMLRATDLAGFKAAMRAFHSTPFVNTIYADRAGNAFYVDGSRVPRLSSNATAVWKMARANMPAVKAAWRRGIIALDGSMKMFEWRDGKNEPAHGIGSFDEAPQLTRRDFVFNANDSFWIANPKQPLTNPSPFYGDVDQPLSMRTRMNLKLLTERGPNAASGPDGKFTAAEVEHAALSDRAWAAEALRKQVVARCRAAKKPKLARLCDTLAKWDGRADLDSVGEVLWRELMGTYSRADYASGAMFATKFDPKQPLATPNTLAAPPKKGPDPVVAKLERAAKTLRSMGADPTRASLRAMQYTLKGPDRIPVPGGSFVEGATNVVVYRNGLGGAAGKQVNPRTGLYSSGYPINYGTSFMMVVGFDDNGPKARAIMTYSASGKPGSPHFEDQTKLFGKKTLRPVRFTEADIKADPNLKIETVQAPK